MGRNIIGDVPVRRIQIFGDSDVGHVLVDDFVRAMCITEAVFAFVNLGLVYVCSMYESSVPNNGFITVLVKTSSKVNPHLRIKAVGSGDILLTINENISASSSGAQLPSINKNRQSDNMPFTRLFKNPTIAGMGDRIITLFGPGGKSNKSKDILSGSEICLPEEIVLARSEDYVIQLQNISGSTNRLGLLLNFYEIGDEPISARG